jgi:ribonuclease VapC
MPNSHFILDTSAIFTLIEDEEGAHRVEQVLRKSKVLIPWVTLMEMIYISKREKGEEIALNRYAMIKKMNAKILWETDEPILLTAAKIKSEYPLSFADSVIAAFTFQHQATLLHKDPEYEALQKVIEMEILPYKK